MWISDYVSKRRRRSRGSAVRRDRTEENVIASDRCGHDRSSQVSEGHDMDHHACDASAIAATSICRHVKPKIHWQLLIGRFSQTLPLTIDEDKCRAEPFAKSDNSTSAGYNFVSDRHLV